jgi:hypothetical protein
MMRTAPDGNRTCVSVETVFILISLAWLGNPKPIDEIRLGRGCHFQNGMRALMRCSEDMENHV